MGSVEPSLSLLGFVHIPMGEGGAVQNFYIEINGITSFMRAETGMIQPIPDICQPLLFVITRHFPYKHHHTQNTHAYNLS